MLGVGLHVLQPPLAVTSLIPMSGVHMVTGTLWTTPPEFANAGGCSVEADVFGCWRGLCPQVDRAHGVRATTAGFGTAVWALVLSF